MTTTPAPLPEAAFSLCLKGRLNGIDAQLTVRGQSYQEFVTNVAAVRGLLDPLPAGTAPAPASSPEPTAPPSDLAGWCPIHQVPMKLQSNDRGSWFSHKTAEGWCRGKEKKSA
jgi:hypothetical protein